MFSVALHCVVPYSIVLYSHDVFLHLYANVWICQTWALGMFKLIEAPCWRLLYCSFILKCLPVRAFMLCRKGTRRRMRRS